MAWTSVGTVWTGEDKIAGTEIVGSFDVDVPAGDVVLVAVAKDNASSSNGNTSEFTGMTDDAGNTWTKAREYCNANSAANAGVTVALYFAKVTSAITNGELFTVSFSDSRTASVDSVWQFSMAAGSTVSVAGSADLANLAADPGSLSISGLASSEYLFARLVGSARSLATALTPTGSWTAADGIETTGGSATDNVGIRWEFLITTATGATSDPTLVASTHASTMVAFLETAGATGQPTLTRSFGVPFARPAGFGGARLGG